jgi:hypothetical protein
MNKKTQILLGVGALAVVGYFVWKNNQSKDTFANATGKKNRTANRGNNLPCGSRELKYVNNAGYTICSHGSDVPTVFAPNGTQIK